MFVMAMVMILSILTYAKIESYKSGAAFQMLFVNYMENMERKYINEAAKDWYDDIHVRNGKAKGNPQPSKRSTAKSTLSIGILIEEGSMAKESEAYHYTAAIFKALINNLYGKYDFFKEAQQERPNFLDEILLRLPEAKREMGADFKISKAKDLANLDLQDSFLNEILYKMLKGNTIVYEDAKGGLVEEGFPSLLKFINSSKSSKVRVYLASKPILQVLFDQAAADEIIAAREYFYREVRADHMQTNQATERFEGMFVSKVNPLVPLKNLDFSVSKTDPIGR